MSTLNIESLFGVKGYVALVTGGSSGLGFMICKVWLESDQKTLCLCIINHHADHSHLVIGTSCQWRQGLRCRLTDRAN